MMLMFSVYLVKLQMNIFLISKHGGQLVQCMVKCPCTAYNFLLFHGINILKVNLSLGSVIKAMKVYGGVGV
jgi:hypothetical protein